MLKKYRFYVLPDQPATVIKSCSGLYYDANTGAVIDKSVIDGLIQVPVAVPNTGEHRDKIYKIINQSFESVTMIVDVGRTITLNTSQCDLYPVKS